MTQKTNTKNNQTNENSDNSSNETAIVMSTMTQDLKNAVLVVSVVANLFVFTAWVALQVTSQFDSQLSSFLFN